MANMTFGVNLIPKNSDNTQQTLGNSENKWNIYANNLTATTINNKTPVSGVKGNSESSYRTGDVNITAANIGLGNVNNTSDANKQIYEANLLWGGKNFTGSYGPIDAAMISSLGADRLAFFKPEGVTVEYSRDNGASWTDYGATEAQKRSLFASGTSFIIGKADSTNKATANGTKYQLRITLNSELGYLYTVLNKIAIYVSTGGSSNCTVTIDKALKSSPTTYTTHIADVPIAGWSGWNIINISQLTTYGNQNAQNSQYVNIRFTFKANGGYTNAVGLSIARICGFGGSGWATPSNMAANGHLYRYDQNQNAIFPAGVTATSFSGPLTGNVTGNVSGTAANVTGTVAIEHGGTGATTASDARTNLGLGNVENKSSATIRGELTKANVTTALGYTPPTTDTNTWRPVGTGASDAAAGNHTHTTSIATSTGTNQLTLAANTKYAITAGGTSYVFTTPPDNNTDTKVTSAANHYTPSRDTNADKSASASGATAAWNIDVVKGVTVQTDGKGHVTGVNVTSGKIPANPNTDTHRPIQVNGTQALASNTTALNLKAGSNVTITDGGSGAITIAATDTNTWRPVSDSVSSTSSSDAASSKAVKTAYDLAASKTANTGTVTSVATGVGLTGGTITGSGTLKAKLRSETALTIDSAAATTTSGRVYPVAVDKTGYLAVNVPWTSYSNATTSAAGLMSADDKTKLNGIASGAQVNSITGVKGNAESTYRTGNVNLTPANIGALSSNGGTITDRLIVKVNDIDTAVTPSDNQYKDLITGFDKNDKRMGYVRVYRRSDGTNALQLAAVDEAGATTKGGGITIKANADSSIITYDVGHGSEFRKAIGADDSAVWPIAIGGTGATTAAQARTNLGITPANIGAVPMSGATDSNAMTGNLDITRTNTNANIRLKTETTGVTLWLYNPTNGRHGLYSDGYYDGSNFVSSKRYIIERKNDGTVSVADHYNKSEVNTKFTQTIGTFTAPNNAEVIFNLADDRTITDSTAKSNVDTMFTNLPIGFSVRYADFGNSGTFLMLISKVSANYGFVKCISYVDTEYTWIKNGANSWTCKKATLTTV